MMAGLAIIDLLAAAIGTETVLGRDLQTAFQAAAQFN